MKTEVTQDGAIQLTDLFDGILVNAPGLDSPVGICQRDGVLEFIIDGEISRVHQPTNSIRRLNEFSPIHKKARESKEFIRLMVDKVLEKTENYHADRKTTEEAVYIYLGVLMDGHTWPDDEYPIYKHCFDMVVRELFS